MPVTYPAPSHIVHLPVTEPSYRRVRVKRSRELTRPWRAPSSRRRFGTSRDVVSSTLPPLIGRSDRQWLGGRSRCLGEREARHRNPEYNEHMGQDELAVPVPGANRGAENRGPHDRKICHDLEALRRMHIPQRVLARVHHQAVLRSNCGHQLLCAPHWISSSFNCSCAARSSQLRKGPRRIDRDPSFASTLGAGRDLRLVLVRRNSGHQRKQLIKARRSHDDGDQAR